MAYKYKVKEAESRFKLGDVKVDNGTKSTITNIDPNTGAISWSIDYVPNIDKLVEDVDQLTATAKGVYQKTKDDKKFLDIYEQARSLRNTIRTHVRNNYPDAYKKAMREGDVDETSMSGAAGSYLTPYAFSKNKKSKGTDNDSAYTSIGYKAVKEKAENIIRKKFGKVPKAKKVTSKQKMKLPSGMVSSFGVSEGKENPGATLGPGPAASEDGVKDNYYIKGFKYKLVPKNKQGTYVQKGSSMPVRKLWG